MYEDKNIEIKKRPKVKKIKKKKIKKEKKKIKISKPNLNLTILKGFDWKQLTIKIIIIFAVMFLIIFTISRINKISSNKKVENSYTNNLTYLTDVISNYYNLKKLPKNNGDSVSMILREMLDFNIIHEIKPNEKENYDSQNSFIIITKEEDQFKLRINLKWSTKELSLTEYLTCNEFNCKIK